MIRTTFSSFSAFFCICFLIACENTVNKSDVTIQNAPKIVNEIATTSFKMDVATSKTKWMAAFKSMLGEHNGNIKLEQGNLILNGDEIIGGTIILNMNSISNNDLSEAAENIKLLSHLKNPSLFYTDSFPQAIFEISSVSCLKDETKRAQQCTITGNLSIKGITNTISILADIENMDDKIWIKSSFKLDGKRWHLVENMATDALDHSIKKEIGIEFELEWSLRAEKQM